MAKTFDLFQIHSEGSDCTAPYRLNIIGTPSVSEVITDIKAGREHGSIEVYSKGRNAVVSHTAYGNNMSGGKIDHGFDNHIVIGGKSAGGWGRMDYTLFIN
jgi:hypothetical protein